VRGGGAAGGGGEGVVRGRSGGWGGGAGGGGGGGPGNVETSPDPCISVVSPVTSHEIGEKESHIAVP